MHGDLKERNIFKSSIYKKWVVGDLGSCIEFKIENNDPNIKIKLSDLIDCTLIYCPPEFLIAYY